MQRRPAIDYSKLSSMPRSNAPSAHHLDQYQLAVEKQRLEKELDLLEARRDQIHRRLQQLAHSVEDLNLPRSTDSQTAAIASPFSAYPNLQVLEF